MLRFLGGCVGRLLTLVLAVAVLAVAWYNRHELLTLADRLLDREPEVSAQVADAAAVRLAALGDGTTRAAFHSAELQSLILYRWAPFLPEELGRPRVELDAGRITMEGNVPTDRFVQIEELRDVIGFLPDTASLRAVASFVPLDSGHVSLEIHELGAAGIPIPRRLIPPILDRLRPDGVPGPSPNALAVPLPSSIGNVYVSGDSLVVTARGGK